MIVNNSNMVILVASAGEITLWPEVGMKLTEKIS